MYVRTLPVFMVSHRFTGVVCTLKYLLVPIAPNYHSVRGTGIPVFGGNLLLLIYITKHPHHYRAALYIKDITVQVSTTAAAVLG